VAKVKEPINPFYVLLVVLGIVFFITACAYGTMAYRAISPDKAEQSSHELMAFLDRNGMQLMGGELALLAACTFGAMWLDQFRSRRQKPASSSPFDPENGAERDGKIR
jgi:hypothetical protein